MSHQGGKVVDDTTPATGNFGAIQIKNDAVFSSITLPEYTDASKLQGITHVAEGVIYGRCTAFTLTSGVVIAHNY